MTQTYTEQLDEMWNWLVDMRFATNDELALITSINGYNMETLNDVLYVRTGYRSREQLEDQWE